MFTTYIIIGVIFVGAALYYCDMSNLFSDCDSLLGTVSVIIVLLLHTLTWPMTIYSVLKKLKSEQ